jgi:ubiquinone/menaquinone biosynthesis C-methylase UbiE
MKQKKIFLDKEGDQWFKRNLNRDSRDYKDIDSFISLIKDNDKILEIGSSDGTKLDYLSRKTPSLNLSLFGIDPSYKSINVGGNSYPNLNLKQGTSDHIAFDNQYFDIVILGFCLYLVDRELLFKTISEVDRTLKQGGYLIITDFETPFPIKRIYEHFEDCFSYKNNYSDFFLGGGHYSLVNRIHFSNSTDIFNPDINERVSTSVLYKEYYSKIYRLG